MSKPMGIGEIPQNARVWIYGTGAAGKGLLFQLRVSRPDVRPLGFLDSFRSGRVLGLRVRTLEGFLREGLDREGAMILVASAAYEAIAENLDSHGVSNYRRSVVPPPIMSRLGEAKLWKSLARIFLRRIFSLFSLLPGGLRPFTLFTGGYGGLFAGNSKALFLEFLRRGERAVWLYSERSVGEELKREGVRAVRYGSLLGFLLLPLCRLLVVDNRDWPWNYPLLPLFPLRRVQLWHGVGMKKIEKMLLPAGLKERLSLPCREEWNLRYPHYDLLVTTSPFYAREVFAPAFAEEAEEILTTGYPLNDLFHREPYPEEWLFTDQEVVGPVKEHLRRGGRVAVYAPTFRDLERRLALERILDPLRLDRFLQERGILLVLKGHSFSLVEKASSRRFSHILTADNGRDIYPILRLSQLLITLSSHRPSHPLLPLRPPPLPGCSAGAPVRLRLHGSRAEGLQPRGAGGVDPPAPGPRGGPLPGGAGETLREGLPLPGRGIRRETYGRALPQRLSEGRKKWLTRRRPSW